MPPSESKRRAATTPQARENELITLAMDLAEKQLRDGTASAQVITHLLKLGSMDKPLERRKLRGEADLLTAKVDAIADSRGDSELVAEAVRMMSIYQGRDEETYDDY